MGSYDYGKKEVCEWIRLMFPKESTILDVGACDGKWHHLLPEYENMDAVEVYEPNMQNLTGYRQAFLADIRHFKYEWYDLIIFGDILEHMTPMKARDVLKYAKPRCKDLIIAVPFLYKQGAEYGNPYEVHIQDDLTAEIFEQRYPGYSVLFKPNEVEDYRYYHKGEES